MEFTWIGQTRYVHVLGVSYMMCDYGFVWMFCIDVCFNECCVISLGDAFVFLLGFVFRVFGISV